MKKWKKQLPRRVLSSPSGFNKDPHQIKKRAEPACISAIVRKDSSFTHVDKLCAISYKVKKDPVFLA